jgi:hypothetical protein
MPKKGLKILLEAKIVSESWVKSRRYSQYSKGEKEESLC